MTERPWFFLPIGSALIAVEQKGDGCEGCYFEHSVCRGLQCVDPEREDGKNVIFEVIDLRGKPHSI